MPSTGWRIPEQVILFWRKQPPHHLKKDSAMLDEKLVEKRAYYRVGTGR